MARKCRQLHLACVRQTGGGRDALGQIPVQAGASQSSSNTRLLEWGAKARPVLGRAAVTMADCSHSWLSTLIYSCCREAGALPTPLQALGSFAVRQCCYASRDEWGW